MTGESQIACTVVVPSYSGAHRLPELLEAFTAQVFEGTWELLVIVDGRMDDTEQLLGRYQQRLPIRWILHEESKGISRAMNAGILAARGRIVIRCDDDLTPKPDFLSVHMSHHRTHAVGVVGPTLDVFDDTSYARAYGIPANRRALSATYARDSEQNWIAWAANNSAPRADLLAVGGFDEDLYYGEDSELGFRLYERGLPISVDARLETPHRGPAKSAAARVPRAFISGSSTAAFRERHPGAIRVDIAQPVTIAQRLWNKSVAFLASRLRERERCAKLGRVVDCSLPFLPDRVNGKLLSFCVEAAGLAGRRYGQGNTAAFREQKSRDIASEKNSARAA